MVAYIYLLVLPSLGAPTINVENMASADVPSPHKKCTSIN